VTAIGASWRCGDLSKASGKAGSVHSSAAGRARFARSYGCGNPSPTEAEAAAAITDVYDAVHALLDRDAVDGEPVVSAVAGLACESATDQTVSHPPVGYGS